MAIYTTLSEKALNIYLDDETYSTLQSRVGENMKFDITKISNGYKVRVNKTDGLSVNRDNRLNRMNRIRSESKQLIGNLSSHKFTSDKVKFVNGNTFTISE